MKVPFSASKCIIMAVLHEISLTVFMHYNIVFFSIQKKTIPDIFKIIKLIRSTDRPTCQSPH